MLRFAIYNASQFTIYMISKHVKLAMYCNSSNNYAKALLLFTSFLSGFGIILTFGFRGIRTELVLANPYLFNIFFLLL